MTYKISESGTRILKKALLKAEERKQKLTTLHLLLVFCEEPGLTSSILSYSGVRSDWIRDFMKLGECEPPDVFDKLNKEAQILAEAIKSSRIQDLHLLAGLLRIEESLACRCLTLKGLNVNQIYSRTISYLTGTGKRSSINPPHSIRRLACGGRNDAAASASPAPTWTVARSIREECCDEPHAQMKLPLKIEPMATHRSSAPKKRTESPPLFTANHPSTSKTATVPPAAYQEKTAVIATTSQVPTPMVVSPLRWKIDEKQFPIISQFGTNLNLKAAAGELDELLGREQELECLMDILGRRRANNPVLIGESGVGKTAIVEGLAQRIVFGKVGEAFSSKIIVALSGSSLFGGTGTRGSLCEKFSALKKEATGLQGRLILFFDDAMEIFKGIDSGGEGVMAEIKEALSQGSMPSIFTATPSSWKRMREIDVGFLHCLTPIQVGEVRMHETLSILHKLSPRYASFHGVEISPRACEAAVNLSTRYLAGRKNPEKSLMVLDLAAARASRLRQITVTEQTVAQVVSSLTEVPVTRLAETDSDRLILLEAHLRQEIVGHEEAISKIASAIRRNAAGFRGKRPIGSFLFLGPTGVGKTELAKAMARIIFGKEGAMIRMDMSEFSEPHSISRLIGAPPGYVGFEKGGELTDAIADHPYRLVLMDEFEKAHGAVHRLLLQILEEGRLTDGHGRTADFSNAIVVMTSNLGSDLKLRSPTGFAVAEKEAVANYRQKMIERALETFSPELMNRIDETIVFSPLTRKEVREIARRLLTASASTLRENKGIGVEWDEEVVEYLIEAGGFDPHFGARPMRRTIQAKVESQIASAILAGKLHQGDSVHMYVEDGGTSLRYRIKKQE